MIRNLIYAIVFLTCCIACQSLDKAEKPKIIIDEDRMVDILSDIAFIKAAKSSNRKTFVEDSINPEAFILRKYDIDSIVFAENNTWYTSDMERYKALFERVKTKLEKERTKFEALKKEEDSIKKIEDSIQKSLDTLKIEDELINTKDLLIEDEIEMAKKKRVTPTPDLENK
ncbi:DUF4296 domain-containing protein [Aquimarina sp. AU119]|uniref:DUF4296 domain-containing protein n=1 Tax=Aquimarina sp. AU119 TaxID=2108528 RepID=UPI000D694740|nr:DUF4296 domain-containing protein [Aquimarina sp. AU119]